MKKMLLFLVALQVSLGAFCQIPNGNFEDWETIDGIENPDFWSTNNYYIDFTPVLKTSDALEGNYSMKVSSTARDWNALPTWPGCAHVKLMPSQTYLYMKASLKIDSINEGRIEIRAKQKKPDGFFEKIGGWESSTVTNGVIDIGFPLEQMQLDTLLIEVWAFNKDKPEWEINETYSEVILDNLGLTNTNSTDNTFDGPAKNQWMIGPNPVNEVLRIRDMQLGTVSFHANLYDVNGRLVRSEISIGTKEGMMDINGLSSGAYFLEIIRDGKVIHRSKIVVTKD